MDVRSFPAYPLPQAFVRRRLHSITGIWLTLYIVFHLFTNSQAALWIGNDGKNFIDAVNSIQNLPFLPAIEILLLAFPILIHMIWGIKYVKEAKMNSFGDNGNTPYLPEYSRNRAYSWQRITAWLLVLGIIGHIIHMRVLERPLPVTINNQSSFAIRLSNDPGLPSLASRLGVALYDANSWDQVTQDALSLGASLNENQVIAVAKNFGTAELLMVRNTFKIPVMLVLYTLFVMAAVFHGFNGLWTFMITWGITLTEKSQRMMLHLSHVLMVCFGILGLSAVWLTYWVNLKY